MPILDPRQIHQVLKEEMKKEVRDSKDPNNPKSSLADLLENANLTPSEVLDNLSAMMRAGDSDGVRLNAAKVALELNGLINGQDVKQVPNVTIVIHDSQFAINPILTPR